jgi:hypothetical protein
MRLAPAHCQQARAQRCIGKLCQRLGRRGIDPLQQ